MSFLEGLLNKGKAKLKELSDSHPPSQSYPGNQPHQGYNQPPQGYNQQPQYYAPQSQYQNYPPQQQFSPPPPEYNNLPPPPIPSSTRPGSTSTPPIPSSTRPTPTPSQSAPYWQPTFNPSIPISQLFQQETGAHGWGNNEVQNYTADAQNCFFTPNNQLVLRGIVNSNKHTSARLVSHQKLGRQRGCLSATLKAPCAAGIWPAFWLLPAAPFAWPNDGEIDIFESWNGDCVNHSCLHWGHYNGEDWNKHRVWETPIFDMPHREVRVALAWAQDEDRDGAGGKLVWYLDGVAVMKAPISEGMRRLSDWKVIINVAMGGNVCGGRLPVDGTYDFVVRDLGFYDAPVGGWDGFERDFLNTREGKTM